MTLLRRPPVAVCSFSPSYICTVRHHHHQPQSWTSSSHSSCLWRRPSRQQQQQQQQQAWSLIHPSTSRRHYATVHHRSQHPERNDSTSTSAPEWPRSPHPTPYEIFNIGDGAPYTKKRFYELVKLYHPDTHIHSPANRSISRATLLRRYRLVVAANDILSDPEKRHLYDTLGIGWTGDADRPAPTQRPRDDLRRADRTWRDKPGNAAGNATWEDWERWYEAQARAAYGAASAEGRRRRDPLYMSNGMFAAIVVIMCMIGAMAQANRAENMGQRYVEWKAQTHAAIGEDMRRSSVASAGRTKDERVDTFLKDRENVAYHFEPGKYESSAHSKGGGGS